MMGEQQQGSKGATWRALGAMLPMDHILRRIDGLLDMQELRDALAPHYSARGRPSVAPDLLIRMALIGRLYGITSERRLCEEVRFNLAYRWFCRLPLDAKVPNHSTFSKNRHGRFRDANVFRVLFEQTVRRCVAAGLVARKDAAIDASFIAADASWQRKMRDGDTAASRLSKPVREWLVDQANAPAQDHGAPRGKPAALSRTDPGAAWSARTARGRFGYAFNVLIDTPGGVAVEVEASPARFAAEVDAARIMLARAGDYLDYQPKRVAADTAYGSGAFLAFVSDRGMIPHIPVMERSEQTNGKFPREAFRFDPEQNQYTCPAGKVLHYRGTHRQVGCLRYCASPTDCENCRLKRECTSAKNRSVTHSEHENVRDVVRSEMQTPMFQRSMRLRRGVERLFADAKGKRGLTRLHLRGLRGAEEEFLLGAAISNLVLLARPIDQTARKRVFPPKSERINHMAQVSRGRFEQTNAAAISSG
ncbi:IS1182 family transposase [Sphingobium yanoikuyae]|uniref:IS1182 family transposase n=1 Tax=Sphingobium yanoikuyae TaxID=13690 RepID=UPI002FDABB7E